MTDASSQRSASINDVVAVRGGGIPLDARLDSSWILKPEVVEGRRFVDIYTRDYRCQKYLEGNYVMVNHLKKLRDAKGAAAMREVVAEGDPNDVGDIPAQGVTNRPKREVIDRISKVLEISVVTRNGVEATVKVLSTWREKAVLQIELTKENMDLLLEDPSAVSVPFTPDINHPDVIWVGGRNHVRCKYWDSIKQQLKIKSKLIDFDPDMENDQKQQIVADEAEAMQQFFDAAHNLRGDMPCPDESAESAIEGPQEKVARIE
jgi:hypothetical protein